MTITIEGIQGATTYDFLMKCKELLNGGDLFAYIQGKSREERSEMHRVLRLLLTGTAKAPPNSEIISILGKEETVNRIDIALEKLDDLYDFKSLMV